MGEETDRERRGGIIHLPASPNNLVGGLWAERLPPFPPLGSPVFFCFICCLLLLRSHPLLFFFFPSYFFDIIVIPCPFAHGVGTRVSGVAAGGGVLLVLLRVGGAGGSRSGPTGRACHVGFAVCLMFGGGRYGAVVVAPSMLGIAPKADAVRPRSLPRGAQQFLGCVCVCGLQLKPPRMYFYWLGLADCTVCCQVRSKVMPCPRHATPHVCTHHLGGGTWGPGGAEAELMSTAATASRVDQMS